jgi:hypothetical protein
MSRHRSATTICVETQLTRILLLLAMHTERHFISSPALAAQVLEPAGWKGKD